MKRRVHILLTIIFCLFVLCPVTVYAETYNLSGTDMSIQLDESLWYVFTRDNIKNNARLDELGISYDTLYSILYDNKAYMDAVLCYDDGEYVEFFVRKNATDSGIANLSNYSENQVLEIAETFAKEQNAEQYSVYENQYKFVRLEYEDIGYYVYEFLTIVNKEIYVFTFQSTIPFGDWEYEEIENIVDSVNFDIDTTLKEEKTTFSWDAVVKSAMVGTLGVFVVCALLAVIQRQQNKKKDNSSLFDRINGK